MAETEAPEPAEVQADDQEAPESSQEAPRGAPEPAAAEPTPPPAAPPTAPGIRYNDRVLVLGGTGSGKSELVNHQFSAFRCQKLLLDEKDEWSIAGVEAVRGAPAALDWTQPVLHYVMGNAGDTAEVEELFTACFRRRHLVVAVHEVEGLCNYNANRVPPKVNSYVSQGRTHGLGLLGAAQRPLEIPKRARTEADHFFVTVKRPDDLPEVARLFGVNVADLARELEETRLEHGKYSFLWYDKRAGELTVCPELPDHVRAATIVRRVSVA